MYFFLTRLNRLEIFLVRATPITRLASICFFCSTIIGIWRYIAYIPLNQYRQSLQADIVREKQQLEQYQKNQKLLARIHHEAKHQETIFLTLAHAWNQKTTHIELALLKNAQMHKLRICRYIPLETILPKNLWLTSQAYTIHVEGTVANLVHWIVQCRSLYPGLHIQSIHIQHQDNTLAATITWVLYTIKIPST